MPSYDYACTKCENVQEEFHAMSEEPTVDCEKCGSKMKKAVSLGHGGYILTAGSTRNRAYGQRYGGRTRKSDNSMTPSESAMAKAQAQVAEKQASKKDSSDPYSEFR